MATPQARTASPSRVHVRRRAGWIVFLLVSLLVATDLFSEPLPPIQSDTQATPTTEGPRGEGDTNWQQKLDCLVESADSSSPVCDPSDEVVVDAAEQARAFGVSPHGDTVFMRRAVPLPAVGPEIRARFQAAGLETDARTVQRLLAPLANDPEAPALLRYRALIGQIIAALRDGSGEQAALAAEYTRRAEAIDLPAGVPLSDILYLRAEIAAGSGDWPTVVALLEEAVADDAIFFDALWLLVVAHIHLLGDDADVCPAIDRIERRLDQMRAVSTDRTGFMALMRRDRLAVDHSQPVIHYVRGYVALLAGDFTSADAEFARLLATGDDVSDCEQRLIARAAHVADRLAGSHADAAPRADTPATGPER